MKRDGVHAGELGLARLNRGHRWSSRLYLRDAASSRSSYKAIIRRAKGIRAGVCEGGIHA